MWVAEARRLGARIAIKSNKAIIEGNAKFQGTDLMSSDLRASVGLVLAAISSSGRSVVHRVYMLDRGMERFEHKLRSVGVDVKRVS
jgi:UDP-N-acetylglucosamine 1-carboxyvinyltransferase